MSSLIISGDTSGAVTLAAPAVAGTTTLTLQANTGTLALQSDGLGFSQTWQNVSASRSTGTTYYNTTGKPILVSVRSDVSVNGVITVNGVQTVWADQGPSNRGPLVTIVPPGQSYVITGSYLSGSWSELR